jgi:hypothetical protein
MQASIQSSRCAAVQPHASMRQQPATMGESLKLEMLNLKNSA